MFEFTGLRILHRDMLTVGESRVVFPFEYNGKSFSCIFLVDIIPFRLYLTTLGARPMVFELEIVKGYQTNSYLSDYNKLVKYLEIKYDSKHKFVPNDFYEALNKKIPDEFSKRPDYKAVLVTASNRRNIEEINKIYFCGWYRNPTGHTVRLENLEKTRSAFGDGKAETCKDKNISSCWTDIDTDENLKKLNNINKM